MNETTSAESSPPKANGNGAHVAGSRRSFTEEYKRKAVARLKNETVAQVSAALGIVHSVIRRWSQQKPKKKTMASVKGGARSAKGYSESAQRAAVARLLRGESANQIATDLGVHNSRVYAWRAKFAKQRPVAGAARFTEDVKRKMVARLNAGETGVALGKELGVSPGAVAYWRQSLTGKEAKGAKESPTAKAVAAIGVKDAIGFLKHALDEMDGKGVKRSRHRALVELAYFSLLGE
jgi:transposase-like protein